MNILTFDIEEWFVYQQYEKGGKDYFLPIIDRYLNELLDELDKYSFKATFFCLGILSREFPHVIRLIAERGHHIGCHSDKHIFITEMTPKQFREDCNIAKKSIEDLIGKEINAYRAPSFSITKSTNWALEILLEQGFIYDSSIFPSYRTGGGYKHYGINKPFLINTPSGIIKEFPINFTTIFQKRFMFSGGGYFRVLPYPIIKYLVAKSSYNMCYFHIRDFDKEQKKIISPRYFKSYYGIAGSFDKLKSLLNDFEFISLSQALEIIEWD